MNRLFIEKHATKWRSIGLELSITSAALDIIDEDYPTKIKERCKAMLKVWLQRDPEASWEKLFCAVEGTDESYQSASVEKGEVLIPNYIA